MSFRHFPLAPDYVVSSNVDLKTTPSLTYILISMIVITDTLHPVCSIENEA